MSAEDSFRKKKLSFPSIIGLLVKIHVKTTNSFATLRTLSMFGQTILFLSALAFCI